jgi:hypothetical protein
MRHIQKKCTQFIAATYSVIAIETGCSRIRNSCVSSYHTHGGPLFTKPSSNTQREWLLDSLVSAHSVSQQNRHIFTALKMACCMPISDTGRCCNPTFVGFHTSANLLKLQPDSNQCMGSSGHSTDPLPAVAASVAARNQQTTVNNNKNSNSTFIHKRILFKETNNSCSYNTPADIIQ